MPHFFEGKDRRGNGLALGIVAAMAFLVPISVWGLSSLRLDNDAQPVSADNPESKTFAWAHRYFPADETILCTWEGSTLDDPRLSRLVRKIRGTTDKTGKRRGGSKLIDSVQSPHDLIAQMQKNDVPYQEAVERLTGMLVGSGPMRVRLSEFGRARRDKVVAALKHRALESLAIQIEVADPVSSAGALAENLLNAPPAVAASTAGSETAGEAPESSTVAAPAGEEALELPAHDLVVTWRGMQRDVSKREAFKELAVGLRLELPRSRGSSPAAVEDCFQVPGTPAALAITLSEAGQADRLGALHWLSAAARQSGIAPETMHLSGNAVATASLDREVPKLAWNTGVPMFSLRRSILATAALLAGVLTLWLLKSFRLAGLVVGIGCYGTLLTTALVPIAGGAMNELLIILPTLVLVTTLSLGIHLARRWQHGAGADLTAVSSAVRAAFFPYLCTGALIAIGQFSLATSKVAVVREFGIYSGLGILIALAVTLYGLPALLALWPGPGPRVDVTERTTWNSLAESIARRSTSILVIGVVATVACLWGLRSFEVELGAGGCALCRTPAVTDGQYIEDYLAGTTAVDVIVRFDRESQQQLKFLQRRDLVGKIESELKKLPEISGSLSLVDFVAAVPAPAEHASVREKAKYNAASSAVEERVQQGELPAARWLLASAGEPSEFNAEGDELWRVRALAALASHANCRSLHERIDDLASSVLRGTSGNAADKVPPAGMLRNYHPGASHVVTGQLPLVLAARQELIRGSILSVGCACGGMALLLMLVLRNPILGLAALLPNALAIGAGLGVAAWCGVPLDIAASLAASLALAIATDATLRQIVSCRLGIQEGKSRIEALGQALGRGGPAALRTSLVVGAALVMLSHSELVLIGRFGWLTAALLATGAVSNLLLTPALLAGPVGYALERAAASTPVPQAALVPAVKSEPDVAVASDPIPGKPHIGKKSVRIRRAD